MNVRENYKKLKDTYLRESFFTTYALRGDLADKSTGGRYGIPSDYPLIDSPVTEPSTLNNRWVFNKPDVGINGIL